MMPSRTPRTTAATSATRRTRHDREKPEHHVPHDEHATSGVDERTCKNLPTVSVPGPAISRRARTIASAVSRGWSRRISVPRVPISSQLGPSEGVDHVARPPRRTHRREVVPPARVAAQPLTSGLDRVTVDARVHGRRVPAVESDRLRSRDLPRVHGVVVAQVPGAGHDHRREHEHRHQHARSERTGRRKNLTASMSTTSTGK